jgi:rhodanese-related sulfurtransferase
MNFEITPQELLECRERHEEVILIDVREPWEREAASIQPSRHIPMAEILSALRELDRDKHIVIYCHHGVRSLAVTAWLRQQGYAEAQSLAGGIERWSLQIDAAVPRY